MSKDKIDSRRVINIAIPMIFANITVPLLGFVDTTIIGQLGDANLIAALGLGAIFISTLYWLCGFLRMGMTSRSHAMGGGFTADIDHGFSVFHNPIKKTIFQLCFSLF